MKTLLPIFTFFLFVTINTFAQDTTRHDPLIDRSGSYPVFANSAELVHITTSNMSPFILRHDLHDFNTGGAMGGPGTGGNNDQLELSVDRRMDYTAADVNGDGKDKLFISRAGPSNILEVSVSSPKKQAGLDWSWDPTFVHEFPEDTVAGQIRLIAANLDTIPGEELIEVFRSPGGLKGYWYRSFDESTQEPTNKEYLLEYLDTDYGGQEEFDLTTGDLDGDGLDELILIYYVIPPWDPDPQFFIKIWKYNPNNNSLANAVSVYRDCPANWNSMSRLMINAGDFLNQGFDQAVISATQENGNNGRQVYSYVTIDLEEPPVSSVIIDPPVLGNVPIGSLWGLGWETNAVAKDLNPVKVDGDELVIAGPGELAILRFNELLKPYYLFNTTSQSSLESYQRKKFLGVADVNADTAEASWSKEIVLAEHHDTITTFRVFEVTKSESDSITGLIQQYSGSDGSPGSVFSEIVMGDFDGDAIRLGAPTLLTKDYVYQPIVQLNVPPTHFDYLNGEVYDICQVYSNTTDTFKVTYTETQSATTHFSSKSGESWGVSAGLSGEGSLFGTSVKAYVQGSYDRGYYGSRSLDTTVTVSQQISTWGDDKLLATITDYDFWEYPVLAMGEQMGNVLIMIPHHRDPVWIGSRNVIARNWIADHEVGNLFSYPSFEDMSNLVGDRLLTYFTGVFVTTNSQGIWSFDLENQQIEEERLTSNIGAEVGLSVKRWGIEARVSGRYSSEEITTHTSTASKEVIIRMTVGELDPIFSTAEYQVTPFIYWGDKGAMVIDYAVDPSSDPVTPTFWDNNYSIHSDPGFILPYRLDSLKGIGGTSNLKFYNKSLRVSPVAPAADDTAYIFANIYNFSLMETTGPVTVRFYLGDPFNGGTPIVGVGGITEVITNGPILSQNRASVEMNWVVPAGLDNTAKVYSVIDPDNTIAEVHEDNNIGFVPLMVSGATFVEEQMKYPTPDQYTLEQNYPNPFNPSTKIKFTVPVTLSGVEGFLVTLKVYDVLGNEVATLVNEEKPAGSFEVNFNAVELSSGIYFYKLQVGSFIETKKMILLK
jgi:hypothetical protein